MASLFFSLDGRTYNRDDMVRIGCNDCKGCSKCCCEMGDSIIWDPYDIWNFCSHMQIQGGGKVDFALLVSEDGPLELKLHHGMILPNIKMIEGGRCPFLSEQGRCSIHKIRSGLCRLYPLGRYFEQVDEETGRETLSYYILDEMLGCPAENKSQVSVREWLGINDMDAYEDFQLKWHSIKMEMKELFQAPVEDHEQKAAKEALIKRKQTVLLKIFYQPEYDKNFYKDFNRRFEAWKKEAY